MQLLLKNSFKMSLVSLTDLPSELLLKILLYLPNYHSLTLLNTKIHFLAQPLIYQKYYKSRIISFIKTQPPFYAKLCAGLLSCLYKPEWSLGAMRLFVIDFDVLIKVLKSKANPSAGFGDVSSCFLDYQDLVESGTVNNMNDTMNYNAANYGSMYGDTLTNQSHYNTGYHNNTPQDTNNTQHPLILRYSERMDLGTFLVKTTINNKDYLFRCKPVGHSKPSRLYGDGRLVVWDQEGFGNCEGCRGKLDKLQVCEACKVVYYCSVNCQKNDWGRGHKDVCESLGFYTGSRDLLEELEI
jgi:MYND finger